MVVLSKTYCKFLRYENLGVLAVSCLILSSSSLSVISSRFQANKRKKGTSVYIRVAEVQPYN